MTRLIDADALKKLKVYSEERREYVVPVCNIDRAPTVPLTDFKEGYKQAILDGKTNYSRPKGEWIKKVDDVGFISYICSNCGFELELEDCSDSHYCTICGAEMGKE